MKACVIGHPISHSKSPVIHNYWLKKYSIEGSYSSIDVSKEKLEETIKDVISSGYTGFNVTVPYKQEVIKYCDELDDNARIVGAVNTVAIKEGKTLGLNTDVYGFIANLKKTYPDIEGKKAFILGAGGASRAILHGLLEEGAASVAISNRTQEKAKDLALMASDKVSPIEWEQKNQALGNIDILVNTTSLGMTGNPPLDINMEGLPKTAVVSDIVYAPLMTNLLKQAQERENKIVTGIGMLLYQAAPAFKAWTGVMPEVTEELEQEVLL